MSLLEEIISNPAKIVLAAILVDIIAVVLARNDLIGVVIKDWYNTFNIGAYIADVSSMLFGLFLALMLFKFVFPPQWFNIWTFLLSVVIIQLIHDISFAYVIKNTPEKKNNMVDMFKRYIDENNWKILLVDASMMIGCVLLTFLFLQVDNVIIYMLLALALYLVQFFLY